MPSKVLLLGLEYPVSKQQSKVEDSLQSCGNDESKAQSLQSHALPGLLRRTSGYSVHSRGFNLWATTGVLGQFTHVFTPDRWEGKTARNQNAFENNSDSRVEKLRHAAGVHKIDCDHRQVVAPVKTQSSVALSHSTRITPTQPVVAHRLGYKAKSSCPSPQIATPASQFSDALSMNSRSPPFALHSVWAWCQVASRAEK